LQRRAISAELRRASGRSANSSTHLGLGLEVLLGAEALRAPRVAQHVTVGDADARLVRLEIVLLQKLHRMRRHQRQAEARRQIDAGGDQHFVRRRTVLSTRTLHLDVIAAGEHLRPRLRTHIGLIQLAGREQLPDVAQRAARQRDQATVVALRKLGAGDFGAAVAARRQIGGGKQLAQPQVTGAILHQQQQTHRTVALFGCILVADPDIAANDRLDALAARRRIELDHPEQVGQVGDRQCRLAVGRRLRDGLIDARQAIGDRVFAVKTEMDEAWKRRGGHGTAILPPRTPAESADFSCTDAVSPAPTFDALSFPRLCMPWIPLRGVATRESSSSREMPGLVPACLFRAPPQKSALAIRRLLHKGSCSNSVRGKMHSQTTDTPWQQRSSSCYFAPAV
jgi:hypothetical protein